MTVLLNKKDMAASIGISVQAFDRWGVTPAKREGREVFFDVKSVLENRASQSNQNSETDEERDRRLKEARIRLTEAQAISQELDNAKEEKRVVETDFCSFALSRLANDIAAILDTIPLAIQRRFVDMDSAQLGYLKSQIAKSMNLAVMTSEKIPEMLDEYLRRAD